MEKTIGEVRMWAGGYEPTDWLICDGRMLNVLDHPALFSILGTTYGGDGRTTFGIPDMRGRSPKHFGQGANLTPKYRGQKGGSYYKELSFSNLPKHNHRVKISPNEATTCEADTNKLLASSNSTFNLKLYDDMDDSANNTSLHEYTISSTGTESGFYSESPYATINFLICIKGNYPQRQD